MIRHQSHKHGFTLTEMAIVGGLMGFLAILLNSVWSGLAQPSIDIMVRCMLEQEAQLAAMSLAADSSGYVLMKTENHTGSLDSGKLSDPRKVATTDGDELHFYETSSSTGDPIVRYYLRNDESGEKPIRHSLMREYNGKPPMVVASNVYAMTLYDENDEDDEDEPGEIQENWIKVNLTFQMTENSSDDNGYKYKPLKYVFYVPESIP